MSDYNFHPYSDGDGDEYGYGSDDHYGDDQDEADFFELDADEQDEDDSVYVPLDDISQGKLVAPSAALLTPLTRLT
jgi:hypothetical protein